MMKKLSVRARVLTGALFTVSLSLGTASVSVADTTSPVVEDGVYVITSAMDSNKALDVNAESKKDGANVQLWDRNDGNAQRFRVTNLGGNQYSIINEYSGKALDIDGNSKKAGANVHQWTWNNSNNQRFVIEPAKNGGYTIKAVSSSLFLDVKGSRTANGTNVIQWTGNGGKANQRWNLNPYGTANLVTADDKEKVLRDFREKLTDAADIEAFNKLTAEQRDALASYLLGEIDPFEEMQREGKNVEGDFEIAESRTDFQSEQFETRAASKSVWTSSYYKIAGVTITKTSVNLTYSVSSGRPQKVLSYSCVVNANYNPYATVSSSKNAAYVSGNTAVAECLVRVRRGVWTPYGKLNWSDRSNIQYVKGNGAGKAIAYGWR